MGFLQRGYLDPSDCVRRMGALATVQLSNVNPGFIHLVDHEETVSPSSSADPLKMGCTPPLKITEFCFIQLGFDDQYVLAGFGAGFSAPFATSLRHAHRGDRGGGDWREAAEVSTLRGYHQHRGSWPQRKKMLKPT